MPDGIADLRREFDSLVSEAKAFFEEAARETVRRICEGSWYDLSDEQRSRANDIRHRIRCLLARLATPIQGSPLLDKHDFRKFVRLDRAMDAALRFQAFRRVGIYDPNDPPNASRPTGAALLTLFPPAATMTRKQASGCTTSSVSRTRFSAVGLPGMPGPAGTSCSSSKASPI